MSLSRTYTGTEPVRLNKFMGQSGLSSRREADALIAEGLVSLDGETVLDAGRKILPGQTLTLASAAQDKLDSAVTLLLHKPMGYVSGQPEPGKIPAARLLTAGAQLGDGPLPSSRDSLPPIGRLDEDSRGLLILSTDGVVAKAVIGPDADLPKTYQVWVRGTLTDSKIARLRFGLSLDGRNLKRAEVEQIGQLGGLLLDLRNCLVPLVLALTHEIFELSALGLELRGLLDVRLALSSREFVRGAVSHTPDLHRHVGNLLGHLGDRPRRGLARGHLCHHLADHGAIVAQGSPSDPHDLRLCRLASLGDDLVDRRLDARLQGVRLVLARRSCHLLLQYW